jgi:hypothetical protein
MRTMTNITRSTARMLIVSAILTNLSGCATQNAERMAVAATDTAAPAVLPPIPLPANAKALLVEIGDVADSISKYADTFHQYAATAAGNK